MRSLYRLIVINLLGNLLRLLLSLRPTRARWVQVPLEGPLPARPARRRWFGAAAPSLAELAGGLEELGADPRVEGLVVELHATGGAWAHAQSLRELLARPVGESVGLFVGAAEVKMKYRPARGFWGNARRFHRKLRKAQRDPFGVFRLFSKAVPAPLVRQLGPLLVQIASNQRPFAVTNLRQLDGNGVQLQGRDLKVESFFGAVTGIVDSSVLTVYTIGGRMHLHVLASEAGPLDRAVRDDAERAVRLLLGALDEG